MRKTTVIFLLLILIFNIVGYRFVFNYYEQNAVNHLDKKIDLLSYNKNELKEIQIPLELPYYTDRQEENIYGEIAWGGKHYQYVKRTIENNILHIWCLSNSERNDLVAIKNNVARSVSSQQQPGQQEKSNALIKILQTEYLQTQFRLISNCLIEKKQKIAVTDSYFLSQHNPSRDFQPPKV